MPSDRYPRTDAAVVNWALHHASVWEGGQSGPPDIGLSAQQIIDFRNAAEAAQAALNNQIAKASESLAATETKQTTFDTLFQRIGASMSTIDAYSKATKDPSVYARAQVPSPKDPSPRAAPPAPTFGELVQTGSGYIRGGFTVVTGGGAQYQLQRRDTTLANITGPWQGVGLLTEKAFEDQSIPVGLLMVEYRVRAQISTGAASPWSNTVGFNFGSQGNQASPTAGSIVPVKGEDLMSAG